MLTGNLPFQSESITDIYDLILNQKLRIFKGKLLIKDCFFLDINYFVDEWKDLSKQALKFVIKLLEKDPSKRMTWDQALKHKFITRRTKQDRCINPKVLQKLANSEKVNCFRTEMFMLFTNYLDKDTMDNINKCFQDLDTEGTGQIKLSDVISFIK